MRLGKFYEGCNALVVDLLYHECQVRALIRRLSDEPPYHRTVAGYSVGDQMDTRSLSELARFSLMFELLLLSNIFVQHSVRIYTVKPNNRNQKDHCQISNLRTIADFINISRPGKKN